MTTENDLQAVRDEIEKKREALDKVIGDAMFDIVRGHRKGGVGCVVVGDFKVIIEEKSEIISSCCDGSYERAWYEKGLYHKDSEIKFWRLDRKPEWLEELLFLADEAKILYQKRRDKEERKREIRNNEELERLKKLSEDLD